MDSWYAKESKAKKQKGRIKFRLEDHSRFITESCPTAFNKAALCVYLRSIMYAKVQFETHHGCNFAVTEGQFMQLWLKRLEKDHGYGTKLRQIIKENMGVQATTAGLVEAIARIAKITDDPDALVTSFKTQSQEESEHVQRYILRKQKEAKMVLLDGNLRESEMIEYVIRGIQENEPVKYKLMKKFEKGKIASLAQLDTHVDTALKELMGSRGANFAAMLDDTINYTQNPPYRKDRRPNQRQPNPWSWNTSVENLNWPTDDQIPKHLSRIRY